MFPSLHLSFALIIAGFILLGHGIGGNASHTWSTSDTECQILLYTSVPTSSIFKSINYALFASRIWESFGDSGMGYSKKSLIIWVITLTLWSIFNSVLNGIFSKVSVIDNTCKYEFFMPMLMSVMLLDFLALIINTYLFVKPIYLINKMVEERNNDNCHVIVDVAKQRESEMKLKRIAIKQFILSATAIASTFIAYPGIIIFEMAQVWGSIDTVISTFCCILMYKWYDEFAWKLFKRLCCCCCCINWMESIEDVKKLEVEVIGTRSDDTGIDVTRGETETHSADIIDIDIR